MNKRAYSRRIRWISLIIIAIILIIVAKLYLVQIIQGAEFTMRENNQNVEVASNVFDRGTIYFQNKDGSLAPAATVQSGLTIALNPQVIGAGNAQPVYNELTKVVTLDQNTFLAAYQSASDRGSTYADVANKVPQIDGTDIDALNITGLSLSQDNWRYYPDGTLAANVLGLVSYEGNDLVGTYGLEKYYENTLERQSNNLYVNFFAQIFSGLDSTLVQNKPLEGDIVTSIEPNVQLTLEQQLSDIQQQWDSQFSGGIIMDPHTGEIYAMGMNPSFDPNDPAAQSNSDVFSDPLVQNVYEMGSIVKALTMSAALDSGAVVPSDTYDDTACITVDTAKICNFDLMGRGVIPMETILNDSLNVGAAYLATKMGTTTQAKYFGAFGLGVRTGIDLPDEASGLIGNLNSPRQLEFDTASFGQGIAMTPIETVRALGALANNGVLPCPHLVTQIDYTIGVSKAPTSACTTGAPIISETTDQEVTKMLVDTVDKSLFNGEYSIPHYSVAAKTGTAEISEGNGQGYFPGTHYLDSYFAYFPASNPRFIVFYFTYYPHGGPYSDDVLTVPLFNTIKYLINYYNIPPDR